MDVHKLLILRSALVNQLNSKKSNKDKIILDCIKRYNYQYNFLNALFEIDEEKLILLDYYIKSSTCQHKEIKKSFLIKLGKCPEIIVDHISGNHEIKKMINNLPLLTSDKNESNSDESSNENDDDDDDDDEEEENILSNSNISIDLYSNKDTTENTSEQINTQEQNNILS